MDELQQERRQQEFEARVAQKMKQLKSPRSAERKEAAYWLGESGEATAISALSDLYKKDPEKDVREAAGYALGMFRALDEALRGSPAEQDYAEALLRRIVYEGKMGKRRQTSGLVRLMIFLLVTLVLLGALNVVLPALRNGANASGSTPTQVAVGGPPGSPLAVIAELRTMHDRLLSDATILDTNYFAALAGQPVTCGSELSGVSAYTLPESAAAELPALVPLVADLNRAVTQIDSAKVPYEQVCDTLGPSSEIQGELTRARTLLATTLPAMAEALDAAEAEALAAPPPSATPEVPTATPEPPTAAAPTDVPPSPTVEVSIRPVIGGLQSLISDLRRNGQGAYALLAQYWNEIQLNGSTVGCTAARPRIPENYELPPEVAAADTDQTRALGVATRQVNVALDLLRTGWDVFAQQCGLATGLPTDQRNAAIAQVDLVGQTLDNAETVIADVIAGLDG